MRAFLAVAVLLASGVQDGESGSRRPSLEEAIEHLRGRSEAVREAVRVRVQATIAALDRLPPNADELSVAPLGDELAALPPDAAPLLVAHLDPGPDASFAESRRADVVAAALASVGTGAVLGELEAFLRGGSPLARRRALLLVAGSEAKGRAREVLERLWSEEAPGGDELATGVLGALLALSPPERAAELVRAALETEDVVRVDAAFGVLEETGASARESVRGVLDRPHIARDRLAELVGYYARRPEEFGEWEAILLLGLLDRPGIGASQRILVLDRMPELDPGGRIEWLDELAEFSRRQDGPVRTASWIALARLGDRGARRSLLAPLSDRIADAPRDVAALRARAALHLRLDEPDEAVRDYRRAYDLVQLPVEQRRPIGISLARALCRSGKLREAAEVLGQIRLSSIDRRVLRDDPDFAELLEHSRYGSALQEDASR